MLDEESIRVKVEMLETDGRLVRVRMLETDNSYRMLVPASQPQPKYCLYRVGMLDARSSEG